MPAGRYLRTAVLGWIQGDAMPSPPASVWLHLFTSAPDAVTPGDAPTITGYAPIEIEPADWAAISEGASFDTLSPTAAVTFGPFTGGPEEATHAAIMTGNDPDNDEIIEYGTFSTPRMMVDAGVLLIPPGSLDIRA